MNTAALRTLVIYAVLLPLAVFIGWMAVDLANWNQASFAIIGVIFFVLLLPVLLKWHYELMVLSWHTSITVFFLPGPPTLWMIMAGITFGIAVLNRILQKRPAFISATPITLSLLALLAVVIVTGFLRGGLGSRALGSAMHGGKSYYYIIAAVVGYFALASRPILPGGGSRYAKFFFLPQVIGGVSNLVYFAGPAFYFLFLILPVNYAGVQAMSERAGSISRVAGFAAVSFGVLYATLAVHGIRGVLRKWHLTLLVGAAVGLGTLAGYRGLVLHIALLIAVLFVTEGLWKSPIFLVLLLVGGLSFAVLVPTASKLPLSVQRTLSFLPLDIDPAVRSDAEASTEWRLRMWALLVPELPKYVWLGKGFVLNPLDVYLAEEAVRRGRMTGYEAAITTGEYHNGPLSVYIPFGTLGLLTFLMFVGTSIRALFLNYRFGDEKLRTVNRFLLAYFIARVLFFLFAFGALSSDLFYFTGVIGLSVALNKGICREAIAAAAEPIRFRGNLRRLGAPQPGAA